MSNEKATTTNNVQVHMVPSKDDADQLVPAVYDDQWHTDSKNVLVIETVEWRSQHSRSDFLKPQSGTTRRTAFVAVPIDWDIEKIREAVAPGAISSTIGLLAENVMTKAQRHRFDTTTGKTHEEFVAKWKNDNLRQRWNGQGSERTLVDNLAHGFHSYEMCTYSVNPERNDRNLLDSDLELIVERQASETASREIMEQVEAESAE